MNNWITKFIKPGLKTLLKKVRPKPGEDSSWITCGGCQQLVYKEELYKNFFICNKIWLGRLISNYIKIIY